MPRKSTRKRNVRRPGAKLKSFQKDIPRKDRICLKCNELFPSTGPGNRKCVECLYDESRYEHPGMPKKFRGPRV